MKSASSHIPSRLHRLMDASLRGSSSANTRCSPSIPNARSSVALAASKAKPLAVVLARERPSNLSREVIDACELEIDQPDDRAIDDDNGLDVVAVLLEPHGLRVLAETLGNLLPRARFIQLVAHDLFVGHPPMNRI